MAFTSPKQYQSDTGGFVAPKPAATPSNKSIWGFAGNVISGIAQIPGQIADVVSHPIKTLTGLGKVGAGAVTEIPGVEGLYNKAISAKPPEAQAKAQADIASNKAAFDNVKNYFTSRYGSLDKAKEAAYNDPIGVAMDVATVVDIAGGGLKMLGEASGIGKAAEVGQKLTETATAINPAAATTRGVAAVGAKVLSKVEKPFLASYDAEKAAKFAEVGVEPPVSAVTKSPIVKSGEALAAKGLFGKDIIKQAEVASTQLAERESELVNTLKPGNVLSDEKIGNVVKEGLSQYKKDFDKAQTAIYDNFNKQAATLPANIDNTKIMLQDIIKEGAKDLYGKVDQKFGKMLKTLTSKGGVTFSDLKATRTSIGEDLAKSNFKDSALKRLYGSLSDDMEATVVKQDPQLGASLKKMNADYKTGIDNIKSKLSQTILKSNPENIAKNLLKRDSAEMLDNLKATVGDEAYGELKKSFMQNTIENSYTRGNFDVNKFEKNLNAYSTEVKSRLIEPAQQAMIDKTINELKTNKELQQAIASGTKIKEGSQTAFSLQTLGTGGAALEFGMALISGNFSKAAEIAAGFSAYWGASKLFTSGIGKQYLTTGVDLGAPFKSYLSAKAPSIGRAAEAGQIKKITTENQ